MELSHTGDACGVGADVASSVETAGAPVSPLNSPRRLDDFLRGRGILVYDD